MFVYLCMMSMFLIESSWWEGMEELPGALGTSSSFALRLGQTVFSSASLFYMCLDVDFYGYSAFWLVYIYLSISLLFLLNSVIQFLISVLCSGYLLFCFCFCKVCNFINFTLSLGFLLVIGWWVLCFHELWLCLVELRKKGSNSYWILIDTIFHIYECC